MGRNYCNMAVLHGEIPLGNCLIAATAAAARDLKMVQGVEVSGKRVRKTFVMQSLGSWASQQQDRRTQVESMQPTEQQVKFCKNLAGERWQTLAY